MTISTDATDPGIPVQDDHKEEPADAATTTMTIATTPSSPATTENNSNKRAAADEDVPEETTGTVQPEKDEDHSNHNGNSNDAAATLPVTKRRSLCGVCHNEAVKYKCPRCPIGYCSLACARTHKDTHPPPSEEEPAKKPDPPQSQKDTTSTQPTQQQQQHQQQHPFSVLDDAPELRHLFRKYPNLPACLLRICETTQPPPSPPSSSSTLLPHRHPGRASSSSQQPWTKETGLRKGQEALRRARADRGEDGKGVREYCEVVTYLLSAGEEACKRQQQQQLGANDSPTDAQLFERLLAAAGSR